MNINWPELRQAIEIIDGVPAHRMDLSQIVQTRGLSKMTLEEASICDSLACAIGWLSLHPEYQPITGDWNLHEWQFMQGRHRVGNYQEVATKLFGLTEDQARHLFCARIQSNLDDPSVYGLSSRAMFRLRVVKFFDQHQQPVSDEYRTKAEARR